MIDQIKSQISKELNENTIKGIQENEKALRFYAENYQMKVSLTDGTLYIHFTTAEGAPIAMYGFYHAVDSK